VLAHSEHVHIPPRQGCSQQHDDVRLLELQGDKQLAAAGCRLFREFGLPHSWSSSLANILLSNRHFAQLSTELRLPNDLPVAPANMNGKIIANTFEVRPSGPADKIRYAALSLDPLYLFTKHSLEDYLADFLRVLWGPLLCYMQEIYAVPSRFNTIPHHPYSPILPLHQIQIPHPNFIYTTKKEKPRPNCDIHKTLCKIMNPKTVSSPKLGYITTLSLTIPTPTTHPYWHQLPSTHTWSFPPHSTTVDTYTFQISRWGPTSEHSKYHTTLHAKDILQHIHEKISKITPPSFPEMAPVIYPCPVFQLGQRLHEFWKAGKENFVDPLFWRRALDLLNAENGEQTRLIVMYYKVRNPLPSYPPQPSPVPASLSLLIPEFHSNPPRTIRRSSKPPLRPPHKNTTIPHNLSNP
jgi:hypothetical protein